jgi:hypothetical protein
MPPKTKKDGSLDKRANNAKNAANARAKLATYIAKGKALRDESDEEVQEEVEEVEEVEEEVEEEPEEEPEEVEEEPEEIKVTIHEGEFKPVKLDENSVENGRSKKQSPKPKKSRKIEIELSGSDSESDEDFSNYVGKYKSRKVRQKEKEEQEQSLKQRQQQEAYENAMRNQYIQQQKVVNPYNDISSMLKMNIINNF